MVLEQGNGFLPEKVEQERFAIASRFGFLEVGEVWALCLAFVAGDDTVSTEGAGIYASFLGFADVQDVSFLVASSGV